MTDADEVTAARCAHLTDSELRMARVRLGVSPSEIEGPPVGMLVGEAPSPNGMGRGPFAMFPWPPRSSAGRLLRMSEMTAAAYLGRLFRRNLFDECPERWSAPAARERAGVVRAAIAELGTIRVVLLGAKVGDAFGLAGFFDRVEWRVTGPDGESIQEVVAIPHPSGLNRAYNNPESQRGTRLAVLWAAGL